MDGVARGAEDPAETSEAEVLEVRTGDGRRLHVERWGAGSPTVVLEAGMGASHHMWAAVVPAVAGRATVVAYDRSGLGLSPADDAPRDLARLTDDLVDLLDHLGDGPVVLVGHSWGGPIVRSAAAQRPDRTAGLVLVDQSDEGCDLYFAPNVERQQRPAFALLPVLARLGLLRLAIGRVTGRLPTAAARALREDGSVASARAHRAEAVGSIADLRRLRDAPPPRPDVPVTLVSGTRLPRLGRRRRQALVAAHRARAEALPRGRHVAAERSGHLVPLTEPEVVAAEVVALLDG